MFIDVPLRIISESCYRMARVSLQPTFILHQRPYRDTSLLIEAFSREHGRIGLIARGARSGRSKLKPVLQPFQPLLSSWTGRGDLATLTGAESAAAPNLLAGSRLLCGFYLNELLIRLLHRHDPHPELFEDYAVAVAELAASAAEQAVLRRFEKRLLIACGYGLNLAVDVNGRPIEAATRYEYVLEQGPRLAEGDAGLTVEGRSLLALADDEFDDARTLRDARKLLRAALDLYLGGKPLKTREVLKSMRR